MTRLKNVIVLLISLTFFYGCALAWLGVGAGVGIGAYKYIEGRVERDYPLSYSRSWDAVNTALANMQISTSNSMDKGTKGSIDAVRKDGKQVKVAVRDKGQGVTNISVRVGIMGDNALSEQIHDEIASVSGIR